MTVSDQRLYVIFSSVTPLQVYGGENISLSSSIEFSENNIAFSHYIAIKYLASSISLIQNVAESGIVHDTTPEASLTEDLDFSDIFNFSLTFNLSDILDFHSLGGFGHSKTSNDAVIITQAVEEGYIYSPSELSLIDSLTQSCGPGPLEALTISQAVGLTFSKTDTLAISLALASYGVAVLHRDGHEYTYDIKGSGDA